MQHRRYVVWAFAFGFFFLIGISLYTSAFTVRAAIPGKVDPVILVTPGYTVACVNSAGSGCTAACGGCYDSIQKGVDAVPTGGTVRIAQGTYTGSGGAVVEIYKAMTVQGSYDASCSVLDSGQTVIDGEGVRTVIEVQSAGGLVTLNYLSLARGIGDGNCDANPDLDFGGCGGGLYVSETPVVVTMCNFVANTGNLGSLGTGAGGGAFIANYLGGAYAHLTECNFLSNLGSTLNVGWGGGLYIEAGTSLSPALVESSNFNDNVASIKDRGQGGGGFASGYVNINETEFYNNRAGADISPFGYGGALYVWKAQGIELTNNTFISNTAVEAPLLTSQKASIGGAIYATTQVEMTAINNLISKNVARDEGTAVYLESAELTLNAWFWHNTIVGNTGSSTSGAFTVGHPEHSTGITNAYLENNIVAGNTLGLDIKDFTTDSLKTNKNCLWNNTEGFPGDFSIIADPNLTPEYYPQDGSPVLGAGAWPIVPGHAALAQDKDGLSRPQNSLPNIGVFESTRNATFLPLLFRR